MKPAANNTATKPSLIILKIERETFLLPPGKDVGQVLEALSGLRRIKEEYFYNVQPSREIALDEGEAEFSVGVSRRTLVDRDEYDVLRDADKAAREEQRKKDAQA